MELQLNAKFFPVDSPIVTSSGVQVLMTPPLDEDYWIARVDLGSNAIVCFPKFSTIGIGFQREKTDWNSNLPYSEDAETIWEHIEHNKGDETITRESGIAAIRLVQEYAKTVHET